MCHFSVIPGSNCLPDPNCFLCSEAIRLALPPGRDSIVWTSRIRDRPQGAADLAILLPIPWNTDHTLTTRPTKNGNPNLVLGLRIPKGCHNLASGGALNQTGNL